MLSADAPRTDDTPSRVDSMLDALERAIAESPDVAVDALRAADRLIAAAVAAIGRGALDAAAGLPAPILLQMDARMLGYEARAMTRMAATLSGMPRTMAAFRSGLLSWSQTRAIAAAVKPCSAADRTHIDRLVGRHVPGLIDADPDRVVSIVDDEAARRRRDLMERREERAVERSFIAFQPQIDGRASFYGEGDATSIATLVDALDRHANRPANGGDDDPVSRGQLRYDALIALAGRTDGRKAPPMVLAAVDIGDLADGDAAAHVLWSLAGRAPRLSPIGTDTIMCDATVLPVVFRSGRPIAVGDASQPIPRRIRRAIIARDQGCRFPGCDRPAAWADLHHIRPRSRGGPSTPENLISLCRRCHRRIHKRGWRIDVQRDGTVVFTHRSRRYRSMPPTGPPRE